MLGRATDFEIEPNRVIGLAQPRWNKKFGGLRYIG